MSSTYLLARTAAGCTSSEDMMFEAAFDRFLDRACEDIHKQWVIAGHVDLSASERVELESLLEEFFRPKWKEFTQSGIPV
jgi:hypothetical protein